MRRVALLAQAKHFQSSNMYKTTAAKLQGDSCDEKQHSTTQNRCVCKSTDGTASAFSAETRQMAKEHESAEHQSRSVSVKQ
jgi:hypothetical protein